MYKFNTTTKISIMNSGIGRFGTGSLILSLILSLFHSLRGMCSDSKSLMVRIGFAFFMNHGRETGSGKSKSLSCICFKCFELTILS